MIDYSVSFPTFLALILGCAMPFYLFFAARVPILAGRNALQFLVTFLFMLLSWGGLVLLVSRSTAIDIMETVIALCILGSASLFYLEVWALLSRGYTLGLLLTLFLTGRPLTEQELASSYHGGDGLGWIMEHRLSGLSAADLVTIQDGIVSLTQSGALIARLYRFSVSVLGLRKTG